MNQAPVMLVIWEGVTTRKRWVRVHATLGATQTVDHAHRRCTFSGNAGA